MPSSNKVRCFILVLFTLWVNVSTTAGITYGMTSLTGLMNKEIGGLGQFWEKCKEPPDDCTQRDQIYSNIFSISVTMGTVGAAIAGVLVDLLGPKAAAMIGLLFFGTGNYLVATANSINCDVDFAILKFAVGFTFISMGGQGPYIASYNIGNVTRFGTTLTSLIAALFNCTGMTYFFFSIILDKFNMSVESQREFIGLVFTFISMGQAVLIYLLWPVQAYGSSSDVVRFFDFRLCKPKKAKEHKGSPLFGDLLTKTQDTLEIDDSLLCAGDRPTDIMSENHWYIPLKKESVKVQLLSKEFMLGTWFYSVSLLAMSFYLGTIYVHLDGKEEWLATNVLCQANITPVVLAWPCALLLDRFGFSFGMGTVCISSAIMFGTLVFDSVLSFAISLVFLATFRCFLFATFFGYIGSMFGFDNYGTVVGVASLLAGVLGQFVIVLDWVGYSYDFSYVYTGLAVATGFLFPLALTLGVWERDVGEIATIAGDPKLSTVKSQCNFGSKITYWWSRVASVNPRRLRMKDIVN